MFYLFGLYLSTSPSICYLEFVEWVLNIDFIYHMSPNRKLFTSLGKLGGVVVVDDDHAHNVIENGTIRIHIYDGIVKEVHRARYVPSIENVVLIRALESNGHKVTMENKILKVERDSLVVMMSVRNRSLNWISLSSKIGAPVTLELEVDSTSLKHKALDHSSIGYLQALAR